MADRFRIALVVPLVTEKQPIMLVEYLGFGYIASLLRQKGYEVDIIDAYVEGLSICNIVARLNSKDYQLIGFTLMSSDYLHNTCIILDHLPSERMNNTHITVGGYYATNLREELLAKEGRIDSLIVGEGEFTFLELTQALQSHTELSVILGLVYRENQIVISNAPRPLMTEEELQAVPLPARDTLQIVLSKQGRAQILTSRGCFGRCGFCAVRRFFDIQKGQKWRGLPPEMVVFEIEKLVLDYGVDYIYFADEEFIGPGNQGQNRAQKIAQLIIQKKLPIKFNLFSRVDSIDITTFTLLKQAGLDSVFLGVEFGVQELLDFYNKGVTVEDNIRATHILKDLEIKVYCGYLMFEPTMSLSQFLENYNFYTQHVGFKLKHILRQLAIYPGTVAYSKIKNLVTIDEKLTFDQYLGDHYKYDFADPKVDILYRLLSECLPVISPSKGYRRLIKVKDLERRQHLLHTWSEQISQKIQQLVQRLDRESELSSFCYRKYADEFTRDLQSWDDNFFNF